MGADITSAILATVVCITIAIAILVRRERRSVYRSFSVFALCIGLWHTSSLLTRLAVESLLRWHLLLALAIPPTALRFYRGLVRDPDPRIRQLHNASFFISGGLALLVLSPLGTSEIIHSLMGIYVLGILAAMLEQIRARVLKTTHEDEAKLLRYVWLGGVVALTFAAFSIVFDFRLLDAQSHIAITAYMYFLYQSIIAKRVIEVAELLGKGAVLGVLTIILASIYILLVFWVGENDQGLWLFNTIVASFVVLILFDQIRPSIENLTGRLFLRDRYQLRNQINVLQQRLPRITTLHDLRDALFDGLQSPRINQIALYVASDRSMRFQRIGYRGAPTPDPFDLTEHPHVLSTLRNQRRPVLYDALVQNQQGTLPARGDRASIHHAKERIKHMIATMDMLHAIAMIPIWCDDDLTGFVVLGSPPGMGALSSQELASLLTLAESCAAVIENTETYEALRERDRLAAVGEMATGLAHEIRNPLSAIKGAVQCLDPKTLPSDANSMLTVIVEEVDRLNHVVGQFLDYARPGSVELDHVDMHDILTRTLKLLEPEPLLQNIHIDLEFEPDLPLVRANAVQLKQVFLNLIRNAAQAMPQGGTLGISTARRETRHGDTVLVRFSDTGMGIDDADLPNIFVPFFTTKQGGTGLGLPICDKIIAGFGGSIIVRSRKGQGTAFTVRLPVAE